MSDGVVETIPAMVANASERFGERLAIADGERTLSYAGLVAAARTFGAALAASGVAPGDRVAIWMFNGIEWVVALLGIFEAGAVLVPINTRFKGGEAADILSRSRARALLTVTDFLGTDYVAMLDRHGRPDCVEQVVVLSGPVPRGAVAWERGVHPHGTARQLLAIRADGDRTERLAGITAPTLVLHGTDDPLIDVSGGHATAAAIPGSRLELLEGMGHDVPAAYHARLDRVLLDHLRAARS